MMKRIVFQTLWLYSLLLACNQPDIKVKEGEQNSDFKEGEFGYDLRFLKMQDSTLVILKNGEAQLIVSPRYQAKVFTSTAQGERGLSFGWINYKIFGNKADTHMNAYGGENRLWLGPEGGKYSLFFKPGTPMVFDQWKTPAAIDTESWTVKKKDSSTVLLNKEMNLQNYKGTNLRLMVDRSITILDRREIKNRTGISIDTSVYSIGYKTENILTNKGEQEWTDATGMPCIWILDMFKPSPATVIVVPFRQTTGGDFSKIATTNYFGEIPADRLKHNDSLLFFKADGRSRGKLGVVPGKAKQMAGSYDAEHKTLTIILFDLDPQARYLNQEWNITKPAFSGDAVNAYNDGPLANGTQMGPFYEIESVSPAAFLKPGESITHRHFVFHFTGNQNALDEIAKQLLGISLKNINGMFLDEANKKGQPD